jgi:drug/metabolite transporter (DMT)-like permease
LIICGLLWFGAYNALLNQAERMVDAGTAAMLVNIGTSAGRLGATTYLVPPVAIVMGWLLLGDVPPWLVLPEAFSAWPAWR